MKISDQNWPKKPIIETSLIFCLFFSVVSVIALIKASRFSSDSMLAIRRISFSFLLIITRLIFLIDWSFVISALPEVLWPWNLKNPDLLNASAKEPKMTMISIQFILEVLSNSDVYSNDSKTKSVAFYTPQLMISFMNVPVITHRQCDTVTYRN